MPQGKGTYKKKYNVGGNVDPFSTRNAKGVPAEQMADAMENQNMANAGLPTSNAQERSQVSPDVEQYKEGGKVKQGSLAERISTGIKNRQNFKDRKKAWGVEEARKAFEEDTMKQRMKRTEAKRQAKKGKKK
jgi:hypothetical protein